jgi:hypothetical protein
MPAYVAIEAFVRVLQGKIQWVIGSYTDQGMGYSPSFGWHIKWHPMAGHPDVTDRFHVKDEVEDIAAYYLFEKDPLRYLSPGPNGVACRRSFYEKTPLKMGTADGFADNFITVCKDNGLIKPDIATAEAEVAKQAKKDQDQATKMDTITDKVFGAKDAPGEKNRLAGLKRRLSLAKIPVPQGFPEPKDLRENPENAKALVDQAEMDVDELFKRRTVAPPPIGMTLKPGAVAVLATTPADQTPAPANESGEPLTKKAKT